MKLGAVIEREFTYHLLSLKRQRLKREISWFSDIFVESAKIVDDFSIRCKWWIRCYVHPMFLRILTNEKCDWYFCFELNKISKKSFKLKLIFISEKKAKTLLFDKFFKTNFALKIWKLSAVKIRMISEKFHVLADSAKISSKSTDLNKIQVYIQHFLSFEQSLSCFWNINFIFVYILDYKYFDYCLHFRIKV